VEVGEDPTTKMMILRMSPALVRKAAQAAYELIAAAAVS
jgi:hypothetical protein